MFYSENDPLAEMMRAADRRAATASVVMLLCGLALAAVFAMACCGCRQWNPAGTSSAIALAAQDTQRIADPVVRAETRRQTIEREAMTAAKAVEDRPSAAAPLATVKAEAVAQRDDLADAITAVENAGNAMQNALRKAEEDQATLAHLRGQWYVRLGVWIERMAWIIGIGWIALNVVAFAGGIGSPGTWLFWIAKQLRLFLPGMNASNWAAAWWITRGKA
jgi:hypothetical protein